MSEFRTRPLVLFVDDDEMSRLLASESLDSAGFDVVTASSGDDAVKAFDQRGPDIVLLDAVMPGLDGYETCRLLRRDRDQDIPILMMTASDDEPSIERSYGVGATDFITKPFNHSLLPHRLRYALRAALAVAEARDSQRRLACAQRLAKLSHWELDMTDGTLRWSEEARRILGLPPGSADDGVEALLRWVHDEDRAAVASALAIARAHQIEYRIVAGEGRERWIRQDAELVKTGQHVRLLGAVLDITELRRAEIQARELAYVDSLTGLPNRAFVRHVLAHEMAAARRDGRQLAVLSLDLDGFKRVNDTLGHAAGDELLREVATRLTSCLRGSDSIARVADPMVALDRHGQGKTLAARLGGDEFVILLSDLRRPEDAGVVAQRIAERLAVGFRVGAAEAFVTSSIGIACFPANGDDVDALLDRADAAMYHAKETGRGRFHFFTPSIHDKARRRMELESTLRASLVHSGIQRTTEDGSPTSTPTTCEFELHYQPKVESPSGRIVGAEALLRWSPRDLGPVSPAEFIPITEDTGLIVPLGEWVLRTACVQAKAWALAGEPLRVAVNVSPRQFQDPGFVASVANVLRETGLEPSLLEFEITESTVMEHTDASARLLEALKALGVRLALDDFGTGYSSLSYLARLPIDALKIDRSFIRDLGTVERSATITSAMIALSRGLDIDVVVEGVETPAQLAFLEQQGKAEIQGFLFARPMPAKQLEQWRRAREEVMPFSRRVTTVPAAGAGGEGVGAAAE